MLHAEVGLSANIILPRNLLRAAFAAHGLPLPAAPRTAVEITPAKDAVRQHIESALAATSGCIEGARGAASPIFLSLIFLSFLRRWRCHRPEATGKQGLMTVR
jgi:hypothetical protein